MPDKDTILVATAKPDDIVALYKQLTGKTPTEAEIAEMKQQLAKAQSSQK